LRSALHDLLATGREHGFQCLDTVVGRFHEEVLHDGLRALELLDEHLGMDARRHRSADLGVSAVADRTAEDDDDASTPRLHEVVGFAARSNRAPTLAAALTSARTTATASARDSGSAAATTSAAATRSWRPSWPATAILLRTSAKLPRHRVALSGCD